MYKYFILDIKRILKSKKFLIIITIGLCISFIQFSIRADYGWWHRIGSFFQTKDLSEYKQFGTNYPHPWYESWIGGEFGTVYSYLYYMILPLTATFVFSDSIYADRHSGYCNLLFLRGDKKKYYIARYISAFVSGVICVCIPLIFNMGLCIATLPSIPSDPSSGTSTIITGMMWADIYYAHPMLYELLYMMVTAVFSGLIACIGCGVGDALSSYFLGSLLPFACYVFMDSVCATISKYEWSLFAIVGACQRSRYITLPVILIEVGLLLCISSGLFIYSYMRNKL